MPAPPPTAAPRPGLPRAGVGAVSAVAGAALLVGAAALGAAPSAVVAAGLAVALAVGWPGLLALPSPRGTTSVIALSGVAAALAVAADGAAGPGGAGAGEPLRRLPVVLALTVLVASAHQLLRRDLRPRVVDGLGGTLLGAALAGSAAAWVVLPGTPAGASLALVAACAAATACLLLLLPLPALGGAALSAGGSVLVAAAVAAAAPGVPAGTGAVLGVVVAVIVLGFHHLLARLPAAGRVRSRVALVAAPLTASGTAAYVVGAALVG